jgi:hypothetical protein
MARDPDIQHADETCGSEQEGGRRVVFICAWVLERERYGLQVSGARQLERSVVGA